MTSHDTILERWDITAEELTQVIDANPSLRGMILGYLAEMKLEALWLTGPDFSELIKPDDHDRSRHGDRTVRYKGHEFIFESKSLQTASIRQQDDGVWTGKAQVDASDRREVALPDGSTVATTCLVVGSFDILAVNVFAFDDKWRFVFAKNDDLPRSSFRRYTPYQQQHLLATLVTVTWPPSLPFRDEPFTLMNELIHDRI